MSTRQIPNLPVATALSGAEQLEAVQAGTSVRVTAAQIAQLAGPFDEAPLTVPMGGTGVSSGTPGGVLYFSGATSAQSSAELAADEIVIGGGAGNAPSTTPTGSGVVDALGVNVGSAGAFVVNGGDLGTPSSGDLTNCTGLPINTGVTGVDANAVTFLETPTLANLETAIGEPLAQPSQADTVAQFELTSFAADVKGVSILGYYAVGTGSLNVRRVASEPAHPWKFRSVDRYLPNGSVDNADGGWWEGVTSDSTYNIQSFGAVGDGVTDDSTAFENFSDYAQGKSLILFLPSGCDFHIPNARQFLFSGIKNLTVYGYGASFTEDSQTFLMCECLPVGSGNHIESRFDTAYAGEYVLTLQTPGDAALYSAGEWVYISAYDLQFSSSYPPNHYYNEFCQIDSVDTDANTVTLKQQLSNEYRDNWPSTTTGPTTYVDLGGPAQIYKTEPTWDAEFTFFGVTFNQPKNNPMYSTARRVEFVDCAFVGPEGTAPSSSMSWIHRRCSFELVETDKMVTHVLYEDCYIGRLWVQSASIDTIDLVRTKVYLLDGTNKNFKARDSVFGTVAIGASYGWTNSVDFENCKIAAFGYRNLPQLYSDMDNYADGVITYSRSSVASRGVGLSWFAPGAKGIVYNDSGNYNCVVFDILDITADETNYYVKTTLPDPLPSTNTAAGTPYALQPYYDNIRLANCTGDGAVDQFSMASSEFTPMRSCASSVFNGTDNLNSRYIFGLGVIDRIVVNVIRPYTGTDSATATLRLREYNLGLFAGSDPASLYAYNPTIDLKTAGVRTIAPNAVYGAVETDDITPIGTGDWIFGAIQPWCDEKADMTDTIQYQPIVEVQIFTSTGPLNKKRLLPDGGNLPISTVAQLPLASKSIGCLRYISDASNVGRYEEVVGGGSNNIIVYSDGTGWYIL